MIQVREYAYLTTDTGVTPSLDLGIVTQATFDWLIEMNERHRTGRMLTLDGREYLKLDSYVGYLQSPAGEAIEVLPKTGLGVESPSHARRVLRKMLCSALKLTHRESGAASLERMAAPLHEWIFTQFLTELNQLLTRGLRFDYQRIDEESRFIRGQLDIVAQQRQPPGRAHLFQIRHDIYSPNRIENRLLKTALDYVRQICKTAENWRLANELTHLMAPVDSLSDPLRVLPQWGDSKLLFAYRMVKPWCGLILQQLNPNFQKGMHQGIALLFPMERLFETHVAACLGRQVSAPWRLRVQPASCYLVEHQPLSAAKGSWFNLQPDLMLTRDSIKQVLDTKWKLLSEVAATSEAKYRLSQQDFYQLFAYGQKYQQGRGDMMLIYPRHTDFTQPLPCFHFDSELRLWVVPFCTEQDKLLAGEWQGMFPALCDINIRIAVNNESYFAPS